MCISNFASPGPGFGSGPVLGQRPALGGPGQSPAQAVSNVYPYHRALDMGQCQSLLESVCHCKIVMLARARVTSIMIYWQVGLHGPGSGGPPAGTAPALLKYDC
jgi:hypothetical protein